MATSIANMVKEKRLFGRRSVFTDSGWVLAFMAVPCILFIILFNYVPIFGWIYAFFDYKPGIPLSITPFVGFDNFKAAITDPQMLESFRNTLAMNFLSIMTLPLAAIMAIMLNEMRNKRYSRILQVISTLPNFVSFVIVFSVFFLFLTPGDGVLNLVLVKAGIISQPTDILSNNAATWYFQTLVRTWKEIGYGSIIYLAAIAGIDPELYDAASVDGAGRFRKIIHVTVPELIPTFMTLLIISVGYLVSSDFEQYYVFDTPLVHDKITVLDFYVFIMGIKNSDYAYATAVGMAKTITSILLILSVNRISKSVRGQSII